MKLIGILIHQIACIFFGIDRWIDNHPPFSNVGWKLHGIGIKLYPTGYCSHCTDWLEVCYNGSDKEASYPFCCTCNHSLTDEQKRIVAERRARRLKKQKMGERER